jgi:dTDP-glucose 4,6-dehydratase
MGQALRGEDLTVFGDGSQTRSFCFVEDEIEGIYRLLMSDYHLPLNIGNPDEISILDFAKEIIKLTGTDQKIVFKPLPKNDPLQRKPDITKAREILGWQPKIGRKEGMQRTYDYFNLLTPEELKRVEHRDFTTFKS